MSNREIISELNNLDLSTYPYKEVKELVSKFQPKILTLTISQGCVIERIRPNVDVFERKEVSYKPYIMNKSPQRATLPRKTAFYGTLCHEAEPTMNTRYIALLEASKLLRKGAGENGEEQYTLSRWVTNKPMKLAVIVDESYFNDVNNNRLLIMAKQEWERRKTFLDEPLQYNEYSEYVTSQFARQVTEDYEYIISATIAEMLMYASGLDGVVYPPVQSRGEYGMNVALRPNVADAKLILIDVHEMKYVQRNGEGHLGFTKTGVPTDVDARGMKCWKYNEWKR